MILHIIGTNLTLEVKIWILIKAPLGFSMQDVEFQIGYS